MFKPLSMRHVMIQILLDDLPELSLTLAELGVFAPDHRHSEEHALTHIPAEDFRRIHRQAQARMNKLHQHFGRLPPNLEMPPEVVTEAQLDALNTSLGELWSVCSEADEALRRLDESEAMVTQLQNSLENFANLQVDLGLLQGDKRFLELRIGILPRANLARATDALGLAGFLVYPYLLSEGHAHAVVVGPGDRQSGPVLESAGFRDLPIPVELRDQPEHVARQLKARRANIQHEREALYAAREARLEQHRSLLETAQRQLALAAPLVSLDGAARSSRHLAILSGWVPRRDLPQLEAALDQRLSNPYRISVRRPYAQERAEVPTLLAPHRLLAPFSSLIKQYGVPRYGEIDPSAVFAVTFVLMFGMMFGDIGHGAVIAGAAWLYRQRLGRFLPFGIAAGVSSMAFGVIYGSVFGYEELFPPLWISPLHDPLLLLTVALFWGIGFLLLMAALNIHNRLVEGERAAALLGQHGVATIGLYLGLLWGVYNLSQGAGFGSLPGLLSLGALLALAGYKWLEIEASPGERLMVVVVESFETITGYVSNTLSFLRVAAFSLNHVALAVAVFTLAEMMGPTGHWLMIIFGNLFILVLEGAIVAIQALRLEYYEGFSRFYAGDGKEFTPLQLPDTPSVQQPAT